MSTATGVPHQQAVKVEYAVYILPPVGTQCAMPTMGNIEGPQQVANGSWPSTCPGKVVSPPAKISATTNQTQFIDSTTSSPVGACSYSTLDTSNQAPHMQSHQVGELPVYRSMSKEVAKNGSQWTSYNQGCQPQSQVPSQGQVEIPTYYTPQAGHTLHQAQMQYQMQTGSYAPPQPGIQHPPLHSQFRDQSQFQSGTQFQAHNQPRRSTPAQYHAQPQTHLQPHFPNQLHPSPHNPLQSPIQTQLLAEPQYQIHSHSPAQSFSPVPPQPQGPLQPLQGLHVSPVVSLQTQTQPQIQPQPQAWTQIPTAVVPRSNSHPPIRPRARRTPIIRLQPP